MGVFFPLTFLFILFFIPPFAADNYNPNNNNTTNTNISSNNVVHNITASNPFLSPSQSLQQTTPNSSSFKPTIAVILGVLTAFFSITFLFLLYTKHCGRNSNSFTYGYTHASSLVSVSARRNSGINRAVVESLPLFRFSSLRGQKDGLECAVCLTRFEPSELLRLLPKCKHAFHVECVDTWLDAHSTCPLCRYRVDPEDILLIEEDYSSRQNQDLAAPVSSSSCFASTESESSRTRRVAGRHSYAGERATSNGKTTWFRRSLDSSGGGAAAVGVVGLGYRKDGLLLVREDDEKKRLEHRIIVSGSVGGGSGLESGFHQRWSDVQPSDLLYLRSEMIISQSRRSGKAEADNIINGSNGVGNGYGNGNGNGNGKKENGSEPESSIGIDGIGRNVINSRSVSEITGLSRFSSKVSNNNDNNNTSRHHRRHPERQAAAAGLVSRWLAWISSTSHSDVRSQPVDTIAGLPE